MLSIGRNANLCCCLFAVLTTTDMEKQINVLNRRKLSAVQEEDFDRAEALKQEINSLQARLEDMKATGNGGGRG